MSPAVPSGDVSQGCKLRRVAADAVYSLGIVSLSMRLVSGLDLEGSGTVASSTPVRFSVSLTDAPGSPSYDEWIGWETSEVKTVPEAIVDDDHELVIERVCAIDVSKASGKVSRLSHRSLPGRRCRERVTHGCTRSSAPAGCTCSPALAPRWARGLLAPDRGRRRPGQPSSTTARGSSGRCRTTSRPTRSRRCPASCGRR